jgi:hypothetical protein
MLSLSASHGLNRQKSNRFLKRNQLLQTKIRRRNRTPELWFVLPGKATMMIQGRCATEICHWKGVHGFYPFLERVGSAVPNSEQNSVYSVD